MSIKKQIGELDAKLKAERLRMKKCDQIIDRKSRQTNHRTTTYQCSFTAKRNRSVRGSIQETKFSQGESEEQVDTWSEEIELNLRLADDCANKLQKSYDQIVKEEKEHDREEMREKDLEQEKQHLNQKLQAALKQKEELEENLMRAQRNVLEVAQTRSRELLINLLEMPTSHYTYKVVVVLCPKLTLFLQSVVVVFTKFCTQKEESWQVNF